MQDTSPQLQDFYQRRSHLQKVSLPAADEELRRLWYNCQRPVALLYFIAPMLTRQQLVLATTLCVRRWLGMALDNLPEGQVALGAAEAWANSQASAESVDQACELAMDRMTLEDQMVETTDDEQLRQTANLRSEQAYACASVAHLVNCGDIREDLDKALLNAREDYQKVLKDSGSLGRRCKAHKAQLCQKFNTYIYV